MEAREGGAEVEGGAADEDGAAAALVELARVVEGAQGGPLLRQQQVQLRRQQRQEQLR